MKRKNYKNTFKRVVQTALLSFGTVVCYVAYAGTKPSTDLVDCKNYGNSFSVKISDSKLYYIDKTNIMDAYAMAALAKHNIGFDSYSGGSNVYATNSYYSLLNTQNNSLSDDYKSAVEITISNPSCTPAATYTYTTPHSVTSYGNIYISGTYKTIYNLGTFRYSPEGQTTIKVTFKSNMWESYSGVTKYKRRITWTANISGDHYYGEQECAKISTSIAGILSEEPESTTSSSVVGYNFDNAPSVYIGDSFQSAVTSTSATQYYL